MANDTPHWLTREPRSHARRRFVPEVCPFDLTDAIDSRDRRWIYQSQGRTDWLTRWRIAASAAILSAFGIGIIWGTKDVAVAYAIVTYASLYFILAIPGRLMGMRVRDVFLTVRGALFSALAMAGIVWTAGHMFPSGWPPAVVLLTHFGIGALAYGALIHVFDLGPYVDKDLVRAKVRGRTPATLPA